MTKSNDGGPAFPTNKGVMMPELGMSLRDYIAAAALNGIMANSHRTYLGSSISEIVNYSYELSDTMLKERSKIQEGK